MIRELSSSLLIPPGRINDLWWGQSLATGAAGISLLHTERAADISPWTTAHAWLAAAMEKPVSAHESTGLFFGAPAILFALDTTGQHAFANTRAELCEQVCAMARRRLEAAHARIDRQELPVFAEYDLISGLTGIAAVLLRHPAAEPTVRDILAYLARLAKPLHVSGETLPGWWTSSAPGPDAAAEFDAGHANASIAHGIAGPIALLANAILRGVEVRGQAEALATLCAWFDQWRQGRKSGTWWPSWVTRAEHRAGRTGQHGPVRPSWCYGTAGQARALQLAGIALGDRRLRQQAEQALIGCLTDRAQLASLTDAGICHGFAGLAAVAFRAATDDPSGNIAALLPALNARLTGRTAADAGGDGFLEGSAGVALVEHAFATGIVRTGWDTCLLINNPRHTEN